MQLLENGDFESGALKPGWRLALGTLSKVTNKKCNGGKYALYLIGPDIVEQLLPLSGGPFFLPGKNYRATDVGYFAVRDESLLSGSCFSVKILYGDGTIDEHEGEATNQWQEFKHKVDSTKLVHGIRFLPASDGSSVYIDDVKMEGEVTDRKGITRWPIIPIAAILAVLAGYLIWALRQ